MTGDHDANTTTAQTRPFRILSLDGGGIKGAYTASVLAQLEEATGCAAADHFDLIAGTSTGGIIAIGLGLGRSARQICDFYQADGRKIFPTSGVIGRNLRGVRQLVRPKHDAADLRETLQGILGEAPLGESRCRLVIPAYDVTEGRVFIFKTGHHPRFRFDVGLPAVDVAMATAAAPTYFGAAYVDGHRATYVDGGVWANCPALVALTEATQFLEVPPREIDILSIGTTTEPPLISRKRRAGGVLQWGPGLIELLMTSQVQAVSAQVGLLTDGGLLRINHVAARGRFRLDRVESIEDLVALGRSDAVKKVNLEAVEARFLNGEHVTPFEPVTT